jgi:hypothetical protein
MSGSIAVQPCVPPPPGSKCAEIFKKIDEYINRDKRAANNSGTHGLKHRFPEQIYGGHGPGTLSWNKHEEEIRKLQAALERTLREYEKNNCGPPPPGAWEWVRRPVPTAADWKGPEGKKVFQRETLEAGTKAAGVIAGGYVLYRVIRFLPSLLPPLWPTIPANVAIP